MPLSERLKKQGAMASKGRPDEPLWSGPCGDGPNGGITQSLLGRYLCCKERYRVKVIDGWQPQDTFNHRLQYGQMWHVCEEAYAAAMRDPTASKRWKEAVEWAVTQYARVLCKRYPLAQEQIDHWYNVCKTQFPLYLDFWSKQKVVGPWTTLLQEQVFDVPYTLPSGRVVRLRGKWDKVELSPKKGVYVTDHKTKGNIDEVQIKRQLSFDLQTMLYLVAFTTLQKDTNDGATDNGLPNDCLRPCLGVTLNVVRRPLSGGKGSIVRHKPSKSNPQGESKRDFYERMGQYIKDEPESYFMRWVCDVRPTDIARFKRECLDPELENLCDDYEWWSECYARRGDVYHYAFRNKAYPHHWLRHARRPFGVYDVLAEGGHTDLDEFLATGSTAGLVRAESLFEELQ